MATGIDIATYSDMLVVLGTAGVVVPLVRQLGLNPVIGYIGMGLLLGPQGLGALDDQIPALFWVTVTEPANLAVIAELGVVFLLFLIGLELSYERLKALRRLVFGLGSLQVLVTTLVIAMITVEFGLAPTPALIVGGALALSSTAIVLDVLSRQRRLATATGRASLAVLLAQDLAVVPLLMFVSIASASSGGSVMYSASTAILQAAVAVVIILVVGRLLLRPLFRSVAAAGSSELFIAAVLFVVVGTGVVAGAAGLSMALGAFVAGLVLAETEYRKAIEATIEPFKGLLLGIFFFTVGMAIDVRALLASPLLLIGTVLALLAVKASIIIALARLFRLPLAASIETGLLLGSGGEFAFVALTLARGYDILDAGTASFALTVAAVSMATIPLLGTLGRLIEARLVGTHLPPAAVAEPEVMAGHAIVIGHGRVGQVVCRLLAEHRVPFFAVDSDAHAVARDRRMGAQVYFGDATKSAFLDKIGLDRAAGVILTLHDQRMIDAIVSEVRRLRPDLLIVARARDAEHARRLYAAGVNDAVPETIEASLQVSEAALVALGVPTEPVIASIHAVRDNFRRDLQAAAKAAGRLEVPGVRPITPMGA